MRDDATQRQVDAARPDQSTWLAANAGSGKTRVLTDRVARLLLDGVLPEHILCLTYTKAAATEMQNRLFKRLGGWAMLDQDSLRTELDQLGVEKDLSPDFLRDARTLFARAIETPGGLRIQTIHSFCASLLRRFPLEARVSPQFKEMEDRAAQILRGDILDRMADGPQAGLVRGIAPYIAGDDTDSLLASLTGMRDAFATPRSDAEIRAAYGLAPDADEASVMAQVFLGSEGALFAQLIPHLQSGGKTDATLAGKLALWQAPDAQGLAVVQDALLTQSGTIRKSLGTKKLRAAAGDLFEQLDQLAARTEEAVQAKLALTAADKDIALYNFAQHFLPAYEQEKERKGWLDFDDLITRARDLLNDPAVAAWVLYRLDGGIDHILVDEAQDTSPVQWQVIERLAQEFTSGEGARTDIKRTIFVVGDKKQSIYSFQGADPSEFDRMRDEFAQRLQEAEQPLHPMVLEYSFRSASPILRVVDETFDGAVASGFTEDQKHKAFKGRMPGQVDLWPVVDKVEDDEDGTWFEPLDRVGSQHHTVILAKRVARFIKRTIEAKTPLPVEIGFSGDYEARPVHAGDFLILVRSRSRLFNEIIRACKQEDLPIAGADRLKVMSELAVRDVIALLTFLATPEDSLSLATALRSPLFGLSEEQLFDLAHKRTRLFLWEALRERQDEFPQVMAVLNDLMGQTDFLRPYDLIERILTRHLGRKRLIGRLGQEAEDGVNALLGQALSYEQTAVPSLTGFLEWAQADNLEIKRAQDAGGEMLRVMTVHGSKGLEAPIVILPDCGPANTTLRGSVMRDDDGVLWRQGTGKMPARQQEAVELAKLKEAQERDRLLYVALTRAERWLVVGAAGDLGKTGDTWYDKVRLGMGRSGAVPQEFGFGDLGGGEGLRLSHLDWSTLPLRETPPVPPVTQVQPQDFDAPIPPAPAAFETLSPSSLGGAKALAGADGDSEDLAKARGTALHEMLEHLAHLPDTQRDGSMEHLIAHLSQNPETALAVPHMPMIASEALRVLRDPALGFIFAPETLAEVPISADLPGLGRMHGVIDRLIVTADKVIAVDFKTNRTVPPAVNKVPEGLLRQMGAYLVALQQLYPDRQIETGLLWTVTSTYMPLADTDITKALARVSAT